MLDINNYNYNLPKHYIAQTPAVPRDHSKLMLVDRQTGDIQHKHFYDLADLLIPNDVLVLNQSKVFPARLFANKPTGGVVEILLTRQIKDGQWEALSKPGLPIGQMIVFNNKVTAKIVDRDKDHGFVTVSFNCSEDDVKAFLYKSGHTPLPPYIDTQTDEDTLRKQYQTVYAKTVGSSAAPTAGLHFTDTLLTDLRAKEVTIEYITLHVGPGTFQNLREEQIKENKLHTEYFEIKDDVALRLNKAKRDGKRIIAVGTTTTRALESVASEAGLLNTDLLTTDLLTTNLFIHPPYQFKFIDSLITNFHLPKSSLLMLVSAFVTKPNTRKAFETFETSLTGKAYQEAINEHYRFFSFGDAMWIR